MCKTAINMEQRTVTIKNFLWITDPEIHLRRIAYPSDRIRLSDNWTPTTSATPSSSGRQPSGARYLPTSEGNNTPFIWKYRENDISLPKTNGADDKQRRQQKRKTYHFRTVPGWSSGFFFQKGGYSNPNISHIGVVYNRQFPKRLGNAHKQYVGIY